MEPKIKTVWQKQDCKFDVPADCFCLHHGYKERSSVMIRLNDDGTIYLSDYRESRYPDHIVSVTVPFEVFVDSWTAFIQHLQAKAAEAAKEVSR